MSGDGGPQTTTPAVAIECMNGVVEFVGAVLGIGCFIAVT